MCVDALFYSNYITRIDPYKGFIQHARNIPSQLAGHVATESLTMFCRWRWADHSTPAALLRRARRIQSLTAHAADPDSNLIITLATEGLFQKFRCRSKALVDTVLLIMVLGSNSEN